MSLFLDKFVFNPQYAGHLGAEEEFFTINPNTRKLVPASIRLFKKIQEDGLRPELPVHQVETVTGICANVDELEKNMDLNRRKLIALGRQMGFLLDTTPVPQTKFDVRVYPKPRYKEIKKRTKLEILRCGWVSGLHIHIGCDGIDSAIQTLNTLRSELPIFLALSARSPVYLGIYRGFQSERYFSYLNMCGEIAPPHIESPEHFEEIAKEQGFYDDPKSCWWGIRINPLGTVEIRICDTQEEATHSAELAELILLFLQIRQRGGLLHKKPISVPDLRTNLISAAVLGKRYKGLEVWFNAVFVLIKKFDLSTERISSLKERLHLW